MASDYSKLVEALRCKRDDCEGCGLAFFDKDEGWMCQYAAKNDDAADAIVALGLDNEDYEHENRRLHGEIEALQAEVDALKDGNERYIQFNTDLLNMKEMTKEEADEILESLRNAPVGPIEPMLIEQLPKREEVWKDVIGYEGLYQVSDQARVRNNKGKILKQSVKVGKCVYYKYVKLYKDGQYRQGYVHRMMAECFIPNPDNLPIINHKDEDGTNNRLDNLEWCTVEYNSNYGNAKRNMSRGKRRRAKMEVQDG